MSLKDVLPPIETALEMEPEERAPFVLKYLATQPQINCYNFTLGTGSADLTAYAGGKVQQLCEGLMEAWMWLEKEGFVMPRPGQQHDWAMITRRGRGIGNIKAVVGRGPGDARP